MNLSRALLRWVGLAFWLAFLALVVIVPNQRQARSELDGPHDISRPLKQSTPGSQTSLVRFVLGPSERFAAVDTTDLARKHDPVFRQNEAGEWRQVGYVCDVAAGQPRLAEICWYDDALSPRDGRLVFYRNRGRLEEVIATLLPAEKRELIRERLERVIQTHGEEMTASLSPLIEQSLRESLPLIEQGFRESIQRHDREVRGLSDRLQQEIITGRLVPLAKQEVLPIVRKHAQVPLEEIGRELWERLSVWRFGWRLVYDNTPLPERDLVRQEWERFVEQDAIPVFAEHSDEIVAAIQRSLVDVAANPNVRNELAEVIGEIASDQESRQLARTLLQEALVENEPLKEVWRNIWTSDEASQAITLAGDRLEPVVRQIGDDLFGTREGGIDPNFARVLRNQILAKDRRWIVFLPAEDGATPTTSTGGPRPPEITLAEGTMVFPIVYLASDFVGAAR